MKQTKLSRKEVEEEINEFFLNIKQKKPEEIKKIKKLARSYSIKLGNYKKHFCKKCFSPNLKIRGINNKIKRVECENCKNIMRWKIKIV